MVLKIKGTAKVCSLIGPRILSLLPRTEEKRIATGTDETVERNRNKMNYHGLDLRVKQGASNVHIK
jgi:hypothetical protein